MDNLLFGQSNKIEQQANITIITYNVKRGDLFYKTFNEPFIDKQEFAAQFVNKDIAQLVANMTNGVVVVSENVKDMNGDELHD